MSFGREDVTEDIPPQTLADLLNETRPQSMDRETMRMDA